MSQMKGSTIRIGLVGPLPPPAGGMANQTVQLAKFLEAEGVDVELIRVNSTYVPSWVSYMKGIRALFRLIPYVFRLWEAAGRIQLLHIMANSGWSWHLFAAPALWIGWIRGKPVLVNYRGGQADAFFKSSFFWVKLSLSKASKVIVPSKFLQKLFSSYGIVSEIIPNIVDLDIFRPGQRVRHFPISRPQLAVTRNLEPIYDNATAIHALKLIQTRYPGASLTIAGDGPERPKLEALAEGLGLGLSVSFVGYLDRRAIAELYRKVDVVINPSTVDNMPNSILEAMASAVPVVTTDVGGISAIVDDQIHALLVEPGDPKAMADAVIRLLEDPKLYQKLVSNGLIKVQQYAWSNVKALWMSTYETLISPMDMAYKVP